MLLEYFIYPILIGLFAVVYRQILAYEEVLNWWFRIGSKVEKWPAIWKPIWGCALCIAGQMALWSYGLNWLALEFEFPAWIYYLIPDFTGWDFCVFNMALFIAQAVGWAFTFNKILNRFISEH